MSGKQNAFDRLNELHTDLTENGVTNAEFLEALEDLKVVIEHEMIDDGEGEN